MKRCLLAAVVLLPFAGSAAEHGARMTRHGGQALFGMALMIMTALAIKAGWLALALLAAGLRPAGCRRGAAVAERHFGRSFLAGLLVLAAYLLLFWLAWRIPLPWRRLVTVPLIVLLMVHVLAGFTVLATALGERLEANLGQTGGSTVRAVLLGGGILVLAGLFPGLGQLVDFIVVVAGLGIVIHLLVTAAQTRP